MWCGARASPPPATAPGLCPRPSGSTPARSWNPPATSLSWPRARRPVWWGSGWVACWHWNWLSMAGYLSPPYLTVAPAKRLRPEKHLQQFSQEPQPARWCADRAFAAPARRSRRSVSPLTTPAQFPLRWRRPSDYCDRQEPETQQLFIFWILGGLLAKFNSASGLCSKTTIAIVHCYLYSNL